jgi:hypothetical protein
MYRQLIQPVDREAVYKLFNVLHGVYDQLHVFVYTIVWQID